MADEAKLPTEEEIAQLPRWARVAFAARCARRAFPRYHLHWPAAPAKHIDALEEAIDIAENAAANARAADRTVDTYSAAYVSAIDAAIHAKAIRSQNAARAADLARSDALPSLDVAWPHPAALAAHAAQATTNSGVATSLVRRDFQRVFEESRRQNWNGDTPVPPSVFGPLNDFIDAFVLEAFAPEGSAPHVIGDSLVRLWEAANEYHMARGGGVLTFDEFRQMMPALVPVGPKSEG